MCQLSLSSRFGSRAWSAALLCLIIVSLGKAASVLAQDTLQAKPQSVPSAAMTNGDMSHMSGHMYMTTLRPVKDGDRQKAEALVAECRGGHGALQGVS